ncbi:MAG: TraR/DksA family transcriptional regulator [Acidimicrobiales bacterium]
MSAADWPPPDPGDTDLRDTDLGGTGPHDTWPHDGWEADVAALGSISERLAGIEAALRALDDGSYGRCRICGRDVADDVLAADPLACHCAGHAPARS